MLNRALALAAFAILPSSPAGAEPAPAAQPVHRRFDAHEAARLVPLLQEAVRFPTVAGNERAALVDLACIAGDDPELRRAEAR